MATNYIFNTTVNPANNPESWTLYHNWNISTDGTNWVLSAAGDSNMSRTFTIDSGDDFELNCLMNFPATSYSYCGVSVNSTTGNHSLALTTRWESLPNYKARVTINGTETASVDTGISGGNDINVKIKTSKDGSGGIYINNSTTPLATAPSGTFSNRNITVYFSKYTETSPAYVKSGYLKSPIPLPSSSNFLQFFR